VTFSLTQSVELHFTEQPDLPPAVFTCDDNGMVVHSDRFTNTQTACEGTIGSEHILWDTSDFLRFDPQTLALQHYSFALCDPDGEGNALDTQTPIKVFQAQLVSPCLPFALRGARRTLWVDGTTLYSVYNRRSEAHTLRCIAPNLGMMFDPEGRICGWRMTRYLDVFRIGGRDLEGSAGDAAYNVFEDYFTTFTVAAFDAEEDEVVGLCEGFRETHAAQVTDPRCAALMRWVRDIAERHQD